MNTTQLPQAKYNIGSCEPLVTFLSTNQYITYFTCFCLKTPDLLYIGNSLTLHSPPTVYITHTFSVRRQRGTLSLRNTKHHFSTTSEGHYKQQNDQQNAKTMTLHKLHIRPRVYSVRAEIRRQRTAQCSRSWERAHQATHTF